MPGWGQSPFYLKPLADENVRARHQPHRHPHVRPPTFCRRRPQAGADPWALWAELYAQHYLAEQAVAWTTYLARTSYLLQQGTYVADVAYLYGEGAPAVVPFWKASVPALPVHYGFDYVNDDVLLHHASVQGDRLLLDGGMSYRLLVLPAEMRMMTLALLRKLDELVSNGATMLGPRPRSSPSAADQASAAEFSRLTEKLWGAEPASAAGHVAGKGRVFASGEMESILRQLTVQPDVTYTAAENAGPDLLRPMPSGSSDQDLVWLHRHSTEEEIYFLATQKMHAFDTRVTFRAVNRVPAAWNPITGERTPARLLDEGRHDDRAATL